MFTHRRAIRSNAKAPGRLVRQKFQTLGVRPRADVWRSAPEDGPGRRMAAPPASAPAQQLRGALSHLRAGVTRGGLLDEWRRGGTEAPQERLRPVVPAIADQRSD